MTFSSKDRVVVFLKKEQMEQMERYFLDFLRAGGRAGACPSVRPRVRFYKLSVPSVPSVPVYYSYRNYRPYSHYSKLGGTYRIDMCRLSGRLVPPIYAIGAAYLCDRYRLTRRKVRFNLLLKTFPLNNANERRYFIKIVYLCTELCSPLCQRWALTVTGTMI